MDWISQGDYPKMQSSTPFRLYEFCHFWLRYATLNGIFSRVLWKMLQGCLNLILERWKFAWEARMCSYSCSLGQNWREFGKNCSASTEKRAPRFNDFCTLTTLYEDCIACNVHSKMTSWEENLPRIGLATCLRKEHSGSFNVLNYWIRRPCKNLIQVKKSQHGILEPVGAFWGLEIDSMDWLWDAPYTRTFVRAVEAKLYDPPDYIIRQFSKSCTCSPEVSLTKQSLTFKRRQKTNSAALWALATLGTILQIRDEKASN